MENSAGLHIISSGKVSGAITKQKIYPRWIVVSAYAVMQWVVAFSYGVGVERTRTFINNGQSAQEND